jgi:hypothetical protein
MYTSGLLYPVLLTHIERLILDTSEYGYDKLRKLEFSRYIPTLSLPEFAVVTQQNSPILLNALGFKGSAALFQHRVSLTSKLLCKN